MNKPSYNGRLITQGVGRFVWMTMEPFSFNDSTGRVFVVPAGFLTDFASVPRPLWPIVPLTDAQYDKAAVIHDYAVRWRKVIGITLDQCHTVFYEALITAGVRPLKAGVMTMAVRMFNRFCAGPGDGTVPKELIDRLDDNAFTSLSR